MYKPSGFGLFLREKRKAANLTQDDLATAINKSGQYISNIEKGKNNAPPQIADIDALIEKLQLDEKDSQIFREYAAADRNRLPNNQMTYLFNNVHLRRLIEYGLKKNISDNQWEKILIDISGGKQK